MHEVITPSLLVSMPNLNDPFFQKSVILLCDYTEDSAYGMIINRPSTIHVRDILDADARIKGKLDSPILVGGPVKPEWLWAIHSADFSDETTTKVYPSVYMSSVPEVLKGVTMGEGPAKFHLGSGYAGWGAGQLDGEIKEGAWWVAPMDADLILDMPYDLRWETVLKSLGIDPHMTTFYSPGEA